MVGITQKLLDAIFACETSRSLSTAGEPVALTLDQAIKAMDEALEKLELCKSIFEDVEWAGKDGMKTIGDTRENLP